MGILYAAVMAVLLVAGAATELEAQAEGLGGSTEGGGAFITKEWAWTAGTAARAFTAYGPADQVRGLDPNDPTPHCPDCRLASSIRFVPEGDPGLTEVADER